MKIARIVAKVIVGGVFLFASSNYVLGFMEIPPPEGELAQKFMGAIYMSGLLAFVKVFEFTGGLFLVLSIFLKRYTAVGIVLITPVLVVINAYHLLMDPAGIVLPFILLLLDLFLIYSYFDHFKPIFAKEE